MINDKDIYYTISPVNGAAIAALKKDQCHQCNDNNFLYIDDTIKAVKIDNLTSLVKQGLPAESQGAKDSNIRWAIRDTIQKICRFTNILTRRYNFMLQEGVYTYPVYSCENEMMTTLLKATVTDVYHDEYDSYKNKHWFEVPAHFNFMSNEVTFSRNIILPTHYNHHNEDRYRYRASLLFSAVPTDNFCQVDENLIKHFTSDIIKISRSEVVKLYYYDNPGLLRLALSDFEITRILMHIQTQSRSTTLQYLQNSTEGFPSPRRVYGVTYE